jgi:hypothetical protein
VPPNHARQRTNVCPAHTHTHTRPRPRPLAWLHISSMVALQLCVVFAPCPRLWSGCSNRRVHQERCEWACLAGLGGGYHLPACAGASYPCGSARHPLLAGLYWHCTLSVGGSGIIWWLWPPAEQHPMGWLQGRCRLWQVSTVLTTWCAQFWHVAAFAQGLNSLQTHGSGKLWPCLRHGRVAALRSVPGSGRVVHAVG